MPDEMRERLDAMRAYSESLRRRAGLYREVAGMGDGGTARSLGALQRAPAPGRKLQKIGFIMLWIPEPTGATIAAGAPMILAGRYLDKKYNGATLKDIGERAQSAGAEMSSFKDTAMRRL